MEHLMEEFQDGTVIQCAKFWIYFLCVICIQLVAYQIGNRILIYIQ